MRKFPWQIFAQSPLHTHRVALRNSQGIHITWGELYEKINQVEAFLCNKR